MQAAAHSTQGEPRQKDTWVGVLCGIVAIVMVLAGFYYAHANAERQPAFALVKHTPGKLSNKVLPGVPAFSLDNVIYGDKTQSIGGTDSHSLTIPAGDGLIMQGWAVDSPAVNAASGVGVDVDSKIHVAGEYGSQRDDVKRALGADAFAASGFRIEIPAKELSKGTHVVDFDVYATDRSGRYRIPQLLKVTVR